MSETDDLYDGEYQVVRSPVNRGGASVLCFALLFLYADMLHPWQTMPLRHSIALFAGLVLAGLGLAAWGLRRDKARFPAQIGVLLYVGGLLWIVVPYLGFLYGRYRP